MTVEFTKDKETKRTMRYVAPIGSEVSGSIYIQKDSELAKAEVIAVEVSEKS